MSENDNIAIQESGWIYRVLRPNEPAKTRTCILIHGWTGDEFSMDVFLRAIPPDYAILSPRGPISSSEGGYGWVRHRPGNLAPYQDFKQTAQDLLKRLDRWILQNRLPDSKLSLVGFSQGAAMALSLGIAFPERIARIACLSGFLPKPSLPDMRLTLMPGVKVFIAHGTRDAIIPIERAHEASAWLEQAGVSVTKCESNVGHRLSANCFHALQDFLK